MKSPTGKPAYSTYIIGLPVGGFTFVTSPPMATFRCPISRHSHARAYTRGGGVRE